MLIRFYHERAGSHTAFVPKSDVGRVVEEYRELGWPYYTFV